MGPSGPGKVPRRPYLPLEGDMPAKIERDGEVGDLAGSGTDRPQPPVEPEPPRPRIPDHTIEALVFRLIDHVSTVWGHTFPLPDATGYMRLQRLINLYGYDAVRSSLEWANEKKIVPMGSSAMPLMTSLCRRFQNG